MRSAYLIFRVPFCQIKFHVDVVNTVPKFVNYYLPCIYQTVLFWSQGNVYCMDAASTMPTSGCRKPPKQKVLRYFWPTMATMLPRRRAATLNVIPILTLAASSSVSVVEQRSIVYRRITLCSSPVAREAVRRAGDGSRSCAATASLRTNGSSRGFNARQFTRE
jgi:hypothetical protein